MCRRNEVHDPAPLRAGDWLVAGVAVVTLLFVPPPSSAGVMAGGDEAKAAPAAEPGNYQIRCWQHGRLLFEENRINLPADGGQYALKVAGTDRYSKPIYVADTKNATCLIRSSVEPARFPVAK